MTGNTSFRKNDKNAFMSKDLPIFVEDLPSFLWKICFFDGKPVGEFKREPAVFYITHTDILWKKRTALLRFRQ